MDQNDFLGPAPKDYLWPRCEKADGFVRDRMNEFLSRHAYSRVLAKRMLEETSTDFSVWVDHLLLPRRTDLENELADLGFVEDAGMYRDPGFTVFWHPYADLPRLLLSDSIKTTSCAIKVDSVSHFLLAHDISTFIEGSPYARYRRAYIKEEDCVLIIVERRGCRQFAVDDQYPHPYYLLAGERWMNRRRFFDDDLEGLAYTKELARDLVNRVGQDLAATLFLEGERAYWQKRNQAGQIQKARQDQLGLGWANHDHHTFRSSRVYFSLLIDVLKIFGFKKRERFYAGAEAGWGAQVMEQPRAGYVIFADVDLMPTELDIDFSHATLDNLSKPGTVGLWCALHGESILQAGMHHLEAKFNFDRLRLDLQKQSVETMEPFTDFPHLRQAFTRGEIWKVSENRLSQLLEQNRISEKAYREFKKNGAVGSHLENLQRRDGFKGFNQRGVSAIIAAVNPEKQALGENG